MPTSRDDAGGDAQPQPDAPVRKAPTSPPDDDIILLEDLAPRADIKGGRVSRVFGVDGESDPSTTPT